MLIVVFILQSGHLSNGLPSSTFTLGLAGDATRVSSIEVWRVVAGAAAGPSADEVVELEVPVDGAAEDGVLSDSVSLSVAESVSESDVS